ncbi:MAG: AAA family ATPase, partial [Sediminibacterium sp.]
MNRLIIHAENFTVFQEKQSWEIKKLNFFYGETATGKSSLIKLVELFSAAEFETRDLTKFDPFGPFANFSNILFDKSKPLRVSFEITNALGKITYSYEIELCKKTNTGLIANF